MPSPEVPPLADATVSTAEAPMASPRPLMGASRAALPSPISDVAAGRMAGVTSPAFDPQNVPPLMSQLLKIGIPGLEEAGVSLFETAKSETVFYNPTKVDEETLRQADQNGTLYEIAPPIGTAAPAGQGQAAAPMAPAMPAQGSPLAGASVQQSSSFKAPPASVQGQLSTARTNNIVRPAGGRPMSPVSANPITQRLGARTV